MDDTQAVEQAEIIESNSNLADSVPEGSPLRGVVFGSILSAALWAGLILTGAALIK